MGIVYIEDRHLVYCVTHYLYSYHLHMCQQTQLMLHLLEQSCQQQLAQLSHQGLVRVRCVEAIIIKQNMPMFLNCSISIQVLLHNYNSIYVQNYGVPFV